MRFRLQKIRSNYHISELLGEGLTSCVYKAIRKHSKWGVEQTVALKVFKSKDVVQTLKNEILALSKIQSEHCVKLLGWDEVPQGEALILEYLEGMTLHQLLSLENLDGEQILEIVLQIQQGLKDLSKQGLCHGDLHAKNVFITSSGLVKLLDFGLSASDRPMVRYGTPQFLAPEIWEGGASSHQSDLFSLGLLYDDLIHQRIFLKQTQNSWRQRAFVREKKNCLLALDPAARTYIEGVSDSRIKCKLAHIVSHYIKQQESFNSTIKLESRARRRNVKISSAIYLFFPLMFFHSYTETAGLSGNEKKYSLGLRSNEWQEVSVVRKYRHGSVMIKKSVYTPYDINGLSQGLYEIYWHSKKQKGKMLVHLNENRRIIIE